jgi:hypothetical protein
MPVLAQHSKSTPSWGSPPWLIDIGRRVLGGSVDCDVATSAYWNNHGVKADWWHDEATDALLPEHDWTDAKRVWCNPPGGLVREFWGLCTRLHREHGAAVFWVGFSVEQLSYLQRAGIMSSAYRRAIPPKRVAYMQTPADAVAKLLEKASKAYDRGDPVAGDKLRLKAGAIDLSGPPLKGEQPTHSSYLCLLPTAAEQVERFEAEMRQLGAETF